MWDHSTHGLLTAKFFLLFCFYSLCQVFISFAKHQSEDDKNIAIARVQDSQASRGDRREQRSAEAGRDGTVQSYAVYSHEHRSVSSHIPRANVAGTLTNTTCSARPACVVLV